MRVEISACQHLGLANTQLVRAYCAVSPLAAQLCVLVAHWSSCRRVHAKHHPHFLSTYAWCLLVLHYLQSASTAPSLQDASLLRGVRRTSIMRYDFAFFDCTFCSDVQAARASLARSRWSPAHGGPTLGDVLVGFFEHMAMYALSLALALPLPFPWTSSNTGDARLWSRAAIHLQPHSQPSPSPSPSFRPSPSS